MLNVGIFFNKVYLVLMHKTIDIGALFNEACAKELSFAWLQTNEEIKDNNDQVICFMRTRGLWIIKGSHYLIHQTMNGYQLKYGTWYIAHILKLS